MPRIARVIATGYPHHITQRGNNRATAGSAETYRWSSASAHMTGTNDTLLGAGSWLSPQEQSAYAEFVRTEDEETDNAIRRATRTGRPFGSESFVDMLEFKLNKALKPGKPGRPCIKTGECP